MDYANYAKSVLAHYPISKPEIEFIRHNENMTFKVTERESKKSYLLRIHKPVIEGLFGIQHTYSGISSEIEILLGMSETSSLRVQKPLANVRGEFVTETNLGEISYSGYSTLLEWIDGSTITFNEDNLEGIAYTLGAELGSFHEFSRKFEPSKNFKRPVYGAERIDQAIEELKYGIEINLYTREIYEVIKEVLIEVKNQLRAIDATKDSWGIIHADLQPGNTIIGNNRVSLIDFGFSGFGYYLFDLGSGATIFNGGLRKNFLNGYASRAPFSFENIRYIEGQIFMDTFISYVLFIRDDKRNAWIKESAERMYNTLCKDFLSGKEVFYSL